MPEPASRTVMIAALIQPKSTPEREEMTALGLLAEDGSLRPPALSAGTGPSAARVERQAMKAGRVLNEAYDYARPSSFARGIRFDLGDKTMLLISGTASVDEAGLTVHAGRFPRAAVAHLPEHHGAARVGRRDLARHRADDLLPARHRARLQGLQRGAHGVLRAGSASIRCPRARASRRGSAARTCWSRSRRSPSMPRDRPSAAVEGAGRGRRAMRCLSTRLAAGPARGDSRRARSSRSGGVRIGGPEIVIIAGPCAVESEAQLLATARAVKAGGASVLRGGAFKPRTSPYSFQGLEGRRAAAARAGPRRDGPAGRHRGDGRAPPRRPSPKSPTSCRSARATCRTSRCSRRSAAAACPCCSSAA